MIHLRAYRAIDEEDSCLTYAMGHRQVLEGFNLGNITTNNYMIVIRYFPNRNTSVSSRNSS